MYLMAECDILPNRDGEEEQDLEWIQYSISKDVGKSENTVKHLRSLNITRTGTRKKTSDEIAEKLLRSLYAVTKCSCHRPRPGVPTPFPRERRFHLIP